MSKLNIQNEKEIYIKKLQTHDVSKSIHRSNICILISMERKREDTSVRRRTVK
jgi:hypothetical protein